MRSSNVLALAGYISSASAALKGFNYGATDTAGAVKLQADYEAEFKAAKELVGVEDFTSARLYTTVQSGGGPIQAIPAAIAQDTSLLLGIWCSGGAAGVQAEIAALKQAIEQYGTDFTSRVVGLSVGSEDLYRESDIGRKALAGIGAGPDVIAGYIAEVRAALAGTPLSGVSIGHVDTWTAWVNGTNSAVVAACDWIGFDAYPYFQDTQANGIENGKALFLEAYEATKAATGKEIWITETGWPVSGKTAGSGVPSVENAKTYWDEVGCDFAFDNINTWWYTLLDAAPVTPNPSFGIIGYPITGEPLFDLSCSNTTSGSSSSSAASSTATSSILASASSAATQIVSSGAGLSPSQGSGSGGAALSSATLSTVSPGSTGTSGGSGGSGGSGSGSGNGTFTATSISGTGAPSPTGPVITNAGSVMSGSVVVGFAGALLAMMMAL